MSTAYSTDGINWTKTTISDEVWWYSVCYGAGKCVAVGGSDDQRRLLEGRHQLDSDYVAG